VERRKLGESGMEARSVFEQAADLRRELEERGKELRGQA